MLRIHFINIGQNYISLGCQLKHVTREPVLLRVYESRLCGTMIVIANGLCLDERKVLLHLKVLCNFAIQRYLMLISVLGTKSYKLRN